MGSCVGLARAGNKGVGNFQGQRLSFQDPLSSFSRWDLLHLTQEQTETLRFVSSPPPSLPAPAPHPAPSWPVQRGGGRVRVSLITTMGLLLEAWV